MKRPPYSLSEAQKLSESYQYLIGQPFGKEKNADIECVSIAPYEKISKERFLIFYFLLNSAESALAHGQEDTHFDVLVIARSHTDQHELLQEDLYVWLVDNKEMNPSRIEVPAH